MKNIFKIFALTVLPLLMVSCLQEKYEPYQPAAVPSTAQVYISADNSQSITLAGDQTSFDIKVGRVATSDALTVNISATGDGVKYFSIPSTVSFAAGQNMANLTIGYSLETLGYDNSQSFTISIADQSVTSDYGSSSFTCSAIIPAPWTLLGKGSIVENWWFGGEKFTCNIYQNDVDPNVFRIDNPFGGVGADATSQLKLLKVGDVYKGVTITVPDLVAFDDIYLTYYDYYSADIYALHPGRLSSSAKIENFSYQRVVAYQENGLPGQISLSPFYYMFGVGGWNKTTVGDLLIITFPGYAPKDYSVSNTYEGLFKNASTENDEVVSVVSMGPDVEKTVLAIGEGLDAEAIVDDVVAGKIEGMEVTESGQYSVPMPANAKSGEYTVVAISYGEGAVQQFSYASFAYVAGAAKDDLVEGTYMLTDSCVFTVERYAPYRYVVTDLGIENGTEFWGVYDPVNNVMKVSGLEKGYESYGCQFGALYGYYDSGKTMVYAYCSYASEESQGNDPAIFAVDPTTRQLSSIKTEFAVEICKYASGYPFVGYHFMAKAGDKVTYVPDTQMEESESAASYDNGTISERTYSPSNPDLITSGSGVVRKGYNAKKEVMDLIQVPLQ